MWLRTSSCGGGDVFGEAPAFETFTLTGGPEA